MDKVQIFHVLGIEETKDKSLIVQAYRRELVHHHPEDDPEGFKTLRAAYEHALALADAGGDEKAEKRERTQGELWIESAEQRYASLSARRDADGWRTWLDDDYCVALDTAEEARESFLQFIMSHIYFPDEVWKLFDREFQLIADRKLLEERYPENFLDYVTWNIQNGVFIDFDLFEGDDDADIDGYIRQYYDLKHAADTGDEVKARELFAALESWPLYHPFVDVERMKLAMQQEAYGELENYLCLFEAREDNNAYIRLMVAAASEKLDKWEQASAIYKSLLAEMPDMYAAGLGRVRCLLHDGEYQNAKETVLDVLEIAKNDEQARQLMEQINEKLIHAYLDKGDELTARECIELGWCYLQNEQYDKAIGLVEAMTPPEELLTEYNNLAGRVYLYVQQEEKALPYLKAWKDELDNLDESLPDKKLRKRRLAYAWFCIGLCYQKLGQTDPEKDAEVLPYFDKAIELEKDNAMRLSYMSTKAEWLSKKKLFRETIDVCDQIIGDDKRYLPAYIMRQEAAYELHQGQSVIDDYYRIVGMYTEYPGCYLLAAKTFYNYKEYKEALDIISQADSAGIQTDSLSYLKAKCIYYMAEKMDELGKVCDTYESLLKSETLADEEKEQLRVDIAECLIYMRDYKTALVRVERFMEEYPDNHTLIWIRADVFNYLGRYKEALEAYETAQRFFPDNPAVLCDLGRCLMRLERYEEAIKRFTELLAIDDQYKDAHGLLMEAYHQLIVRERDISYLDKAVTHADRQIELTPTEYDYIQRGILYQDAAEPEKAMLDFLKALELNPDSAYATNNLGFDYRLLNRFEDAIPMLEKSLELRKTQGLSLHIVYQNLAVTLLIMGNYHRAAEVIRTDIGGGRNYQAELLLAEICLRDKRYIDAIKVYEKMIEHFPEEESALLVETGYVYGAMEDFGKADKIIKAQYKKHKTESWYFQKYVEFLLEMRRDYRKVLRMFKNEPKDGDMRVRISSQHYYIEALWRTGKKSEAMQVKDQMLQLLREYGEARFLGIDNPSIYRFDIAKGMLFGGDIQNAEKLFIQMLEGTRCRSCHYCKCFEALYGMGYVRLMEGRVDEAYAYFSEACRINPMDAVCRYYGKEKRRQI